MREHAEKHILRNAFGGLTAEAAGLLLYATTHNPLFPATATTLAAIGISRIESYASHKNTTPAKGLRRIFRP